MTTKQRAYLRGLANPLDPILHVGKDGVTDNLVKQLDGALEARELVKGAVLQNAPVDAREALSVLCERLDAEPVQAIGGRFVLYRPSRDKPRTIWLP